MCSLFWVLRGVGFDELVEGELGWGFVGLRGEEFLA